MPNIPMQHCCGRFCVDVHAGPAVCSLHTTLLQHAPILLLCGVHIHRSSSPSASSFALTSPSHGPAPKPHHASQGSLNRSCWFLGALAAVAAKQHLLLNLVVSDEHAPLGLYTFQFYNHGAWRQVVVDNRLPCIELQQRLAFSSSCTPQVTNLPVQAVAHCWASSLHLLPLGGTACPHCLPQLQEQFRCTPTLPVLIISCMFQVVLLTHPSSVCWT